MIGMIMERGKSEMRRMGGGGRGAERGVGCRRGIGVERVRRRVGEGAWWGRSGWRPDGGCVRVAVVQ